MPVHKRSIMDSYGMKNSSDRCRRRLQETAVAIDVPAGAAAVCRDILPMQRQDRACPFRGCLEVGPPIWHPVQSFPRSLRTDHPHDIPDMRQYWSQPPPHASRAATRHMLLRIGLKLRLVVRRSASGKGHETMRSRKPNLPIVIICDILRTSHYSDGRGTSCTTPD